MALDPRLEPTAGRTPQRVYGDALHPQTAPSNLADILELLRAAIYHRAADDAADLLAEARIEARARVRKTLTNALTRSMLAQVHKHLPEEWAQPRPSAEPPPPPPPAPTPGDPAWYVYGVVRSETELSGSLRGVDSDQAVTVLEEGVVAAVCSRVPLDEFDEVRLRE